MNRKKLPVILKRAGMEFGKVIVVFLLLSFRNPLLAASVPNLPPSKGGKLPIFSLPIPKIPNEKKYLGLSGEGFFKITQIKTQTVLIKIFNLYCPVCQSTASAMVELYEQIENDPTLRDKIKLIGIGVGNSVLEVEEFKENNHIPFPIFADEDFKIHKILGEKKSPFFIAIKLKRESPPEIVHTHLGGFTGGGAFLKLLLETDGQRNREEVFKKEKMTASDSEPVLIQR